MADQALQSAEALSLLPSRPLICCPENDFDITVKLAEIFSLNDVASVTIVTMDKPCCADLKDMVLRAVKQSHMPIPVQVTHLFVDAEEVD